jgi:hypothetical protein
VLVKPNLLRDVNDEFQAYNMEEASVMRKIQSNKIGGGNFTSSFRTSIIIDLIRVIDLYLFLFAESKNVKNVSMVPSKLSGNLDELNFTKLTNGISMSDKSLLEIQINIATGNQHIYDKIVYDVPKEMSANSKLYARLRELEMERNELQKQRSSSCLTRNFVYPLAMLLLLLLTSITVLLVMQNTIELLIGIKALPLSSRVRVLLYFILFVC